MRKHLLVAVFSLTLSLFGQEMLPIAAYAQSQGMSSPTVSVVSLQTQPGQGGQQMVVTPRGMVVPLPGAGVNSNTVQIYMGSQGGYWYVDKYNQNVDLTAGVQRLQAMISQNANNQGAQVPQYAPAPYPYPTDSNQQPVTVNNYESSSGSSGGSAAGTAAVAGLGAMAGAALGSAMWGGVPYGTPYYYGNGGHPYYYGANGKPVYVNNSNKTMNVSGNTVGNTANVNRNVDRNVANVDAAGNVDRTAHANQFQNQQNWYNNQRTQNPAQYQQWQGQRNSGSNPFVHQQANFGGANNVAQSRDFGQQNAGARQNAGNRSFAGGDRAAGGARSGGFSRGGGGFSRGSGGGRRR